MRKRTRSGSDGRGRRGRRRCSQCVIVHIGIVWDSKGVVVRPRQRKLRGTGRRRLGHREATVGLMSLRLLLRDTGRRLGELSLRERDRSSLHRHDCSVWKKRLIEFGIKKRLTLFYSTLR